MANQPGQQAPLSHGNEAEHRRLIASRANLSLPKSGGEAMIAPLALQSVAVADVPAAADFEGAMIYVPDETGGAIPAFSDGTNWRRVTDRAIVA